MRTLFIVSYYILLVPIFALALPILLFVSTKQKHKRSIPSRFFLYKNPPFKDIDVWFHACSLGEVNSLKVLKDTLHVRSGASVVTQTGYSGAVKIFDEVRFLPFEIFLPFWVKKTKMLVVTEAELWLMLFVVAKLRGIKTVLINARISDKSYKNYLKFRFFYRAIFSHVDMIFAQSEVDKERLKTLGALHVELAGNIKTAQVVTPSKEFVKPTKRVIIYASTHEGEEELLLKAHSFKKDELVVVVPRHPERFEKVSKFLEELALEKKLEYKRFSKDGFCECDLLLVDAMGELNNFYAISDVVVLCGSFIKGVGGHNPIEPARFENAIISGEFIHNQKELYKYIENIYMCEAKDVLSLLEKSLDISKVKDDNSLKIISEYIKKETA